MRRGLAGGRRRQQAGSRISLAGLMADGHADGRRHVLDEPPGKAIST